MKTGLLLLFSAQVRWGGDMVRHPHRCKMRAVNIFRACARWR